MKLLRAHRELAAPDLVGVETTAVLRRRWFAGTVTDERFEQAIEDLTDIPLARFPRIGLMCRAFELRANLTAHDACYLPSPRPSTGRSAGSIAVLLTPLDQGARSSATSTGTGTWWRWHFAEHGRAEHGAGAVIPGYCHVSMVFVHPDMLGRSLSTPTCWDAISAASCCGDFTRVHSKEAGAARRCGPGRRMRVLDAFTKTRDIEGQAMRRPLAG